MPVGKSCQQLSGESRLPQVKASATYTLLFERYDSHSVLLHTYTMSDEGIRPPARKLDEFEELVFEYTNRMGLGNEEVR